MKIVLRTAGVILLAFGMIGIVTILGGVASHAPGFTSLNDLWGGLAFHAVTMFLGALCLGVAAPATQLAKANSVGAS